MSLREALTILDDVFMRENLRYALIGGYAVAVWGEIRATQDIDLLCSPGDIERLTGALNRACLKFEHGSGDTDDPIAEVVRIDLGDALFPFEVDVLAGIRGAPAGILERCVRISIEGHSVPVASAEDLIVLKLLAGAARDLEDARSIVQVHRNRLDTPLLLRVCPPELRSTLDAMLTPPDL